MSDPNAKDESARKRFGHNSSAACRQGREFHCSGGRGFDYEYCWFC